MKTKRIISKFFLVLIVVISFYFNSCEREEWCSHCYWNCSFDPAFGSKEESFCANSREECEAEVQDFLDGRMFPSCWECSEPR
jgi:hypothetical protein